ncbi:MAG: MBL fold metallo-hydrolase [Lachnospiraceae bacterium]|nr:MBL fold metallo-hydrolase [Lachnospiraceae bacterium]
MPEVLRVNDRISYIKASTEPLSSDVILVEGDEYSYLFDVGNNEEVAAYLEQLPKKKKIVLSHFHQDHMGNVGRVSFEGIYMGAETEKHLQKYIPDYAKERMSELCMAMENLMTGEKGEPKYQIPWERILIQDGVTLEIYPIPNSHAKGSLVLMIDEMYLFLGDSLYPKVQEDHYVYNAQLLKEEIELLKRLPAEMVFSSHEARPLKRKDGVVRFLEQIYAKREKGEPYIRVSRESGEG